MRSSQIWVLCVYDRFHQYCNGAGLNIYSASSSRDIPILAENNDGLGKRFD